MGIHGLTSFLAEYQDKYRQKVHLSNCHVVVDGCNLMFYLHFHPNLTRNRPYLFGGDYPSYVQNVRKFFQTLKLCSITPVVIFDGAYEMKKLSTAMTRFSKSVRDNIGSQFPGTSYSPVLMKVAFVEVLVEQNVLHIQTEWEADSTIAFVARNLSCSVLSSDSDFLMYTNLITLPLSSISFKRAQANKEMQATRKLEGKHWVLIGKYVPLGRLCEKEFNLNDTRLLLLAAVILGNDHIPAKVFSRFYSNKGGSKCNRFERIAFLLKWLGKQHTYTHALHTMLQTVKESERKRICDLVSSIVEGYMGIHGESHAWRFVEKSLDIPELQAATDAGPIPDVLTTGTVNREFFQVEELCKSFESLNATEFEKEFSSEAEEAELSCEEKSDSAAEMSSFELGDSENVPAAPWVLKLHVECKFPTYLLKILYNRTVFLSPQVEVSNLPSSHALSVPIIQAISGILIGKGIITMVTRETSSMKNSVLPTVTHLKELDYLPCVGPQNFQEYISLDRRIFLVFKILGLCSQDINFVNEWPTSLRLWVSTLLYFSRKLKYSSSKAGVEVVVAIAVIFSCIRTTMGKPAVCDEKSFEDLKVSKLLHLQGMNSCLLQFYKKFEQLPEFSSRSFLKSYKILRLYTLSQYQCVLFHTTMLNKLLGNPLRPARISDLNTHLVYNICSCVLDGFEGRVMEFMNSYFPGHSPIKVVVSKILNHWTFIEDPSV